MTDLPSKPEDFAVVPKALLIDLKQALGYITFHAGPGHANDTAQELIKKIDRHLK